MCLSCTSCSALRSRGQVLTGRLSLEQEQLLIRDTKGWLAEKSETLPILGTYLESWGDWDNPWRDSADSGQAADVPAAS